MTDDPDDLAQEQPSAPENPPPDSSRADSEEPDDGLGLARDIANSYRQMTPRGNRPTRRKKRQPTAQRANRDEPVKLSDLMGNVIKDQGWDDNLAVQRVLNDWGQVVGTEIATHCQIVDFVDGQLEVHADSTAWATQMRLLAPRIVAKLNDEIGQGSVVRINIRAPQAPSWIRGKRTTRDARGPRDTYG